MGKPSRTAVLVCQARAVADGRLAVGRFSDPIAARMLRPAELSEVETARDPAAHIGLSDRVVQTFLSATVDIVVSRTVAIDDAIRTAGHDQLVILGAGLDGRAWRMPELTDTHVFEVDQPASQDDKRSRTVDLTPVSRVVSFVPVEFGTDSLLTAITESGLDPDRPTTWVWEGVLPYLTAARVRSTLGDLAAVSAPGSQLVATYPTRSRVGTVSHYGLKAIFGIARRPNPLASERHVSSWTPSRMRELLGGYGFTVSSDTGQREIAWQIGYTPYRPRSMNRGRVVVARKV